MANDMASGWMTVWRLDTGGQSNSEDAVKIVENNGTTWGDITQGKRRNANRGVEEAYEELKEMYGEEYHFRSPVDETTPHLINDFVPLTSETDLSAKRRDRRQRKCTGRKKFLEAMQERCLALKFAFGAGKPEFNSLDQKLYSHVHQKGT